MVCVCLAVPIEFGRARDDNDDIWGQVIEDEAEKELHNVLNKARKLKQKSKSSQRVEDQVCKGLGYLDGCWLMVAHVQCEWYTLMKFVVYTRALSLARYFLCGHFCFSILRKQNVRLK